MADKRETRKDLPKREFDADLNSPMLSNEGDPPVDQRDSDYRDDHPATKGEMKPKADTRSTMKMAMPMSMTSAMPTTWRADSSADGV